MALFLPTPIGAMLLIEAADEQIVTCEFRPVSAARGSANTALLREAKSQFLAYFRKRLRRFDLPLALSGTPFQCAVWRLVAQLEAGELISYGDVGRAVGEPRAHRGVAAAMGCTPYDLVIPAHRVIGADGTIKGAGPNSLRRRLLQFEGFTVRRSNAIVRATR
jgi:methylated-DNA-[protein]-cysteine S-methyltransferase